MTLVMTMLIAVVLGGITFAGHQLAQLLEEVPRHETNLREKTRYKHSLVGGTGIWQRAIDTLRNVEQEVHDPETEIGRSTQALNEAGSDLAHFLLLQTGLNVSFGKA